MKKIALMLVLLLSCSCVNAKEQESLLNKFKPKTQVVVAASTEETASKREQAVLFYSDNDVKKSFELFLSIPENQRIADDWLLLGNILEDQQRVSDAIFMYQRAILIDSKCYKAYYNLGNIYLEDDKPFMAIDNFRKANRAKNDFPYAYYNLGCAYLNVGDLKKAKIAFLKAIELKNTEPDFHFNLAYTYKKLNKEKLSRQYLDFYNKLMSERAQ